MVLNIILFLLSIEGSIQHKTSLYSGINRTRHLFSETALTLPEKRSYVGIDNFTIYIHNLSWTYSFSKKVDVSFNLGNFSILFLFSSIEPKINLIHRKGKNFDYYLTAGGHFGFVMTSTEESDTISPYFGMPYISFSCASDVLVLTIGGGINKIEGEYSSGYNAGLIFGRGKEKVIIEFLHWDIGIIETPALMMGSRADLGNHFTADLGILLSDITKTDKGNMETGIIINLMYKF
ncbi:hypothetical protein KAW18_04140 [candidate division WOR-3 bacterium]|nr:hypothetical protein [candidate division WOR-3 bacterium]